MTATRTARGRTTAAGRAGRLRYRLTTSAFADETASRHQFADLRAFASWTIRSLTSENQPFEIFVTLFAMILVYGHNGLLEFINMVNLAAYTAYFEMGQSFAIVPTLLGQDVNRSLTSSRHYWCEVVAIGKSLYNI